MPVPPGFVTVTGTVPEFKMADAEMVASTFVALTTCVLCATPLKLMTAPEMKFAPSISSWNGPVPAVALDGSSCEIVGMVAFGFEYPHPIPAEKIAISAKVAVIFISTPHKL